MRHIIVEIGGYELLLLRTFDMMPSQAICFAPRFEGRLVGVSLCVAIVRSAMAKSASLLPVTLPKTLARDQREKSGNPLRKGMGS